MIVRDALNEMIKALGAGDFESPAYEAREIFKSVIGWTSSDLLTKDEENLSEDQLKKLAEWTKKRASGVPLAYLTKEKGFFKHVFAVETGVLVPRPETELVVETALRRTTLSALPIGQIADLGGGTGCIGLSLLYEWPKAQLWIVESSPRAAATALKNSERLNLFENTHIDCIAVESWDPETTFDIVCANPPYIAVGDPDVQKSVHAHEPHAALYSGPDGLEAMRKWIPIAFHFLNPGGLAFFEIGSGQSEAVRAIMLSSGFGEIQISKDLAGHDRVVSAQKPAVG